jgi:hypothetical protein
MIAAIITTSITTLIAPILSAWATSHINQPRPTPDPNQPKNQIQKRGGWLDRVFTSRWFSWGQLVVIPFYIWVLSRELAKTAPITRQSVLGISVIVAAIVVSVLNMHVVSLYQLVSGCVDLMGRFTDFIDRMSESDAEQKLLLIARIETLEKPLLLKNENSN